MQWDILYKSIQGSCYMYGALLLGDYMPQHDLVGLYIYKSSEDYMLAFTGPSLKSAFLYILYTSLPIIIIEYITR